MGTLEQCVPIWLLLVNEIHGNTARLIDLLTLFLNYNQ